MQLPLKGKVFSLMTSNAHSIEVNYDVVLHAQKILNIMQICSSELVLNMVPHDVKAMLQMSFVSLHYTISAM